MKTRIIPKNKLLDACIAAQEKHVNASREAMLQAQDTANEQVNSMGDKFESFREQMQIDRDMYARQYEEGMKVLNGLKRIDSEKKNDTPSLGAVVVTDSKQFFISASLGQLVVDRTTVIAISAASPMFKAMAGKKAGDAFVFGTAKYQIREIY